jgi:hypothetical protein
MEAHAEGLEERPHRAEGLAEALPDRHDPASSRWLRAPPEFSHPLFTDWVDVLLGNPKRLVCASPLCGANSPTRRPPSFRRHIQPELAHGESEASQASPDSNSDPSYFHHAMLPRISCTPIEAREADRGFIRSVAGRCSRPNAASAEVALDDAGVWLRARVRRLPGRVRRG